MCHMCKMAKFISANLDALSKPLCTARWTGSSLSPMFYALNLPTILVFCQMASIHVTDWFGTRFREHAKNRVKIQGFAGKKSFTVEHVVSRLKFNITFFRQCLTFFLRSGFHHVFLYSECMPLILFQIDETIGIPLFSSSQSHFKTFDFVL